MSALRTVQITCTSLRKPFGQSGRIVDGEREEVRPLARLGAPLGGGEHHRLAGADDDGAVRLLRELAGLEADLLVPDLDGDLRPALGRDTHSIVLHSALCLWRAGV
jgi:hypothetical protein